MVRLENPRFIHHDFSAILLVSGTCIISGWRFRDNYRQGVHRIGELDSQSQGAKLRTK